MRLLLWQVAQKTLGDGGLPEGHSAGKDLF